MKGVDFSGKRALIRVDFNVPLNSDKQISDDTRMRKAIPTIRTVLDGGGSIVLMSHLGRPQKKRNADGSIDRDKFSLSPLPTAPCYFILFHNQKLKLFVSTIISFIKSYIFT